MYYRGANNGRCTAVGEPENAMKRRKALLAEEELGHAKYIVSFLPTS